MAVSKAGSAGAGAKPGSDLAAWAITCAAPRHSPRPWSSARGGRPAAPRPPRRAAPPAHAPRKTGHLEAVEDLLQARQWRRVPAAADQRLHVGLERHVGDLLRALPREAGRPRA